MFKFEIFLPAMPIPELIAEFGGMLEFCESDACALLLPLTTIGMN